MQYKAHKYQKFAQNFIETHPVAAVFLDMGLGKTVITLSAIFNLMFDSFLVQRILIVAPLRVARDTWPQEVAKWNHLSELKFAVAVGTEAERVAAIQARADLLIINRENIKWLVETQNNKINFDMVVIDELSSFKNHRTQRSKALMKIRPKVKRIVGLTGTPASNGLMDLWAQYRILDMGQRLGKFITAYRQAYFVPDKRNAQVVFSYKPTPYAEKEIHKLISDITISMKACDHLQMPNLLSTVVTVKLSDSERTSYNTLKKNLILELKGQQITASNAGSLSGKLSQMANGSVYDDDGKVTVIHNQKLDAIEDIIESANGQSVLIAYWFKHDLKRIEAKLKTLKVPYKTIDNSQSIEEWNANKIQVGLIHPASAGHGLNLQKGGNNLIWFSIPWSLELYQQTVARLWRQGQSSKTVVVQHLICEGTIDKRILKALQDKSITQNSLIRAVRAELEGGL
jgi:SNF2 family DNA or RNA helicase